MCRLCVFNRGLYSQNILGGEEVRTSLEDCICRFAVSNASSPSSSLSLATDFAVGV